MVVSGLPNPNEKNAGNIATLAVNLLSESSKFKRLDKPDEMLKIRIGIHSGPVVAGIVGTSTPRYCLFGNTLNVAALMGSAGEGGKIHISSDCNEKLEELGGYTSVERGFIEVVGTNALSKNKEYI